MAWIERALENGATLTVRRVPARQARYEATMEWPVESPIKAAAISGVPAVLDELERLLMLDAAHEMQRSGRV